MKLTRRSFLKSAIVSIGSVLAAPAIVNASSLMKLYVPPKDLILPEAGLIFEGALYPNAVAVGTLHFNTKDELIYIYTGAGWTSISQKPFQGMNVCTGTPFDTRMVAG